VSFPPFTVLPDCTACGACLPTCPERCIRVADRDHQVPLVVLEEQCTGCGECAEVCPAEAIVPLTELARGVEEEAWMRRMGRERVHEIEVESMRILASRVDLTGLSPLCRAVAERVIHSAADVRYLDDLVLDETALAGGWEALAAGAPIVADSRMVAAGITSAEVRVPLAEHEVAAATHAAGTTRSAAAIERAASEVGAGAVWVVGNAPTALEAVVAHARDPALVVGLPVGFVGAVESKASLRDSGLPAISNRTELGGSAVAAAALNALLYTDPDVRRGAPG
jgi:precorrin-8X/cobalt-precorrin-8 methylmutase